MSQSRQAPVGYDISRIVKYAPTDLIGREDETRLLSDTWRKALRGTKNRPNILTFVALGGEGKTSLVAKWAIGLQRRGWPECDAAFAWSFYSQGTRDQVAASSDLFLKESLTFFGDEEDKQFAAGNAGAFEKGQRLARAVGRRRGLLILDGLEPLQYSPTSPTPGELKDLGIAALLKGLAGSNQGLCVVTTRYSIPDLKAFWRNTAPEVKLERLSRGAGVHLLQSLGVKGSLLRSIRYGDGKERVNEFEKLVEDVKGHALTLTLLGSYLRDAHNGDVRRRDLVKLKEADNESDHPDHAFHVMDAYALSLSKEDERGRRALALLSLIGLFDRPASADCMEALWKTPAIEGLTEPLMGMSEAQRNLALKRLEDARLLTVNRDAAGTLLSLDSHPLIREYFAQRLREGKPEAWCAAHKRVYEHLCKTTEDKGEPTLEDLQPLYQAVAHGCLAGLQQEARANVYRNRILRGAEVYTAHKLGAFGSDLGAVACFFDQPWSHVSPSLKETDQAWLLSEAAFRLRALGRLTEALEPMRAGLGVYVKQKDWPNAAAGTGNLSELELTLGAVTDAVRDAERSVSHADRSGNTFQRMSKRIRHAEALHQWGRRAQAQALFRQAEAMQAERQPEYPLLYSVQGFQCCDLLLTEAERTAWRIGTDEARIRPAAESDGLGDRLIGEIAAVSRRAEQTLSWALPHDFLLDIALDYLTLGRAALYATILRQSDIHEAAAKIEQAVSSLRRAGQADYLPRGLLTRAWLRCLQGRLTGPGSAQEDLDEAWEIAERGPMRLFMADIHLHRARLFFREADYPWKANADGTISDPPRGPKDDLLAAEKLINECGYHRRHEELADAKKVIPGV